MPGFPGFGAYSNYLIDSSDLTDSVHPIHKGISMAIERTLSIIKPDAVAKNVIGQIYARFEGAGLKIAAAKLVQLSRAGR